MSPSKKLFLASVALVGCCALLLYAARRWESGSQIPPPTDQPVVRIGYLPIYVDLPLFVAAQRNLFAKHGVRAELHRFAASAEIGDALQVGDVQFGASIAYSVVLANESRDPNRLKVFMIDAETKDNYLSSIVVPATSPIKRIADLNGKTVVSFPGKTAVGFFMRVLQANGVDPSSVTIQELPITSHLDALESGGADGLFTYEPTGTQAVIDKGAVKLAPGAVESYVIDPWQAGVWVVKRDWAEQNPEVTRAVVAAIYEALDYMRANPRDAKVALSGYTTIRPDVALRTPNIPFTKLSEADYEAFQRHADMLLEDGVISRKIDSKSLLAPEEWLPK